MARVKLLPAATEVQVFVPTCPGKFVEMIVPVPSWPLPLLPHAQRVPSVFKATVWAEPAAAICQFVANPTWVGTLVCEITPSPN